MALVAILLVWSILGKADIIVNGDGKVILSSRAKTIASVEVASVRALYVQEGQAVKSGDALIQLDTSTYDAERDKAKGDEALAELQNSQIEGPDRGSGYLKAPEAACGCGSAGG